MNAESLIKFEGMDVDGIAVQARMGEDVGVERFQRVVESMKLLSERLDGKAEIDRDLALAAFNLAYHADTQLRGWAARGAQYRADLFENDLPALTMAVQSLFEGVWVDLKE